MISAAGIMFRAPSGKVLMLRRAEGEDAGGTWALPGGKVEDGESHATAAVRETLEETGYNPGYAGKLHCRRIKDGVDYTTFLNDVDNEFTPPKLNAEHDLYMWIDPVEMLASNGVPS